MSDPSSNSQEYQQPQQPVGSGEEGLEPHLNRHQGAVIMEQPQPLPRVPATAIPATIPGGYASANMVQYGDENDRQPMGLGAPVGVGGMVDPEVLRLQALTADAQTHEHDIMNQQARQQAVLSAMPMGSVPTALGPMGNEVTAEAAVASGEAQAEGIEDAEDEANKRSVYVGNVDYGVTPHELQDHFVKCGKILRVTILVDKYTGHPKGYAYIEFADAAAANTALMLANTTLRGRQIKVVPKRKNIAGLSRGRGGSMRARGRGAAMYYGGPYMGSPYAPPMAGMPGPYMPRGGPYRPIRSRGLRRPRGTPY